MAPKGEPKRRVKLSNPRGDTGKISNNIEAIRGNLNEHIYIFKLGRLINLMENPILHILLNLSVGQL